MPSVQTRFGVESGQGLRLTYSAAEAIVGGQVVERRTGVRIVGVAAAGSLIVAGVSLVDVPVTSAVLGGTKVSDGENVLVTRLAVVPVTFAAAATVGQKLIVAANGQVTPAGAAPDARTVIGEAFEAVALGAVGLAYVY